MKITRKQIQKRIPYIPDLIGNLNLKQISYLAIFLLKNFIVYRFYSKFAQKHPDKIFVETEHPMVNLLEIDDLEVHHSKKLKEIGDFDSLNVNVRHHMLDLPLNVHIVSNAKLLGLDSIPTIKNQFYAHYEGRTHRRQEKWINNFSGSPFVMRRRHIREVDLQSNHYICVRNHTNYYHYITDELIKLYYANHFWDDFKIVNNFPYLNYHRQFRNMIDYEIIEYRDGMVVSDLLEVGTLDHTKEALEFVKEYFLKRAAQYDIDYPKFDYLFSVRSGSRKISNLPEIKSAFNDIGIDILFVDFAESNTIRDINLISQSKGIIGGHGAGLTNMIWGSELKILEIGVLENSSCFLLLSEIMEHKYSHFEAQNIKNNNSDILVSVDDLLFFTENEFL